MTAEVIKVPYKPHKVQAEVHKNLKRFSVVVLHRGAGKSYLAANELIKRAFTCPDKSGALFVYVAPEKQQAKDIIWEKLKYFCREMADDLRIREDELTITFPDNNAIIKIGGADQPDRLRGIHPHFVVLDEVGQMKRDVWLEVVLPAIQRNNGGVLFIGTPKGDNLFKELYDFAATSGHPEWYALKKDVYEAGIYSHEHIESIIKPPYRATPSKFEQEFLCSFDAVFTGAYYGAHFEDGARGTVTDVPYNPMYPVITGWDFGTADKTCIWFAQQHDGKLHLIDYYENRNKDIFFYLGIMRAKGYIYQYAVVPHDGTQRSWESGKSRINFMHQHGFKTVQAPKISIEEGISIVQANLYTCRFDKEKCKKGIEHLIAYRSKTDSITGKETGVPRHDEASDAADALRTLLVGIRKPRNEGSVHGDYENYFFPDRDASRSLVHEYNYFDF